LVSFAKPAHKPTKSTNCSSQIRNEIKANFGSGFEVMELEDNGRFVEAKIIHLENQYLVTNAPSGQWTILTSSLI